MDKQASSATRYLRAVQEKRRVLYKVMHALASIDGVLLPAILFSAISRRSHATARLELVLTLGPFPPAPLCLRDCLCAILSLYCGNLAVMGPSTQPATQLTHK